MVFKLNVWFSNLDKIIKGVNTADRGAKMRNHYKNIYAHCLDIVPDELGFIILL